MVEPLAVRCLHCGTNVISILYNKGVIALSCLSSKSTQCHCHSLGVYSYPGQVERVLNPARFRGPSHRSLRGSLGGLAQRCLTVPVAPISLHPVEPAIRRPLHDFTIDWKRSNWRPAGSQDFCPCAFGTCFDSPNHCYGFLSL